MDVREKLVELICDGTQKTEICTTGTYMDCETCRGDCGYCTILADHLIANGVTVQEWISVKDRLPEPEQGVILCTREIETYGKHHEKKKIYRNIYIGYFDGDEWLTSYCHGCEYIFRMNEKYPNETIEVTHWMPLPEPPKGE